MECLSWNPYPLRHREGKTQPLTAIHGVTFSPTQSTHDKLILIPYLPLKIMPPEEIQLIEDFLTFLENARTTLPATDSLWEYLQSFLTQFKTVDDRPLQLALFIETWCQEFQVTIDPKTMRQIRANMLENGQVIPKPAEGEKASKVYNKASITESVNNAIPEK